MIKFKISTVNYYAKDTGTVVFRDKDTLGYLFSNTGNCTISVNNILIPPGGVFKTFETGYKDITQWRMLFIINDGSLCGGDQAELTTLIYSIEL
jgi:hypothetical protein